MDPIIIVLAVLCVVLAIAVVAVGVLCKKVFFQRGAEHRKQIAEAEIGSAEEEAKRIVEDAVKEAATKKKEALLEAQEEIHRQRSEADKELKDRRSELSRQERRDGAEGRKPGPESRQSGKEGRKTQRPLETGGKEAGRSGGRCGKARLQTLERISQLTVEEAKAQLLSSLEDDLAYEKAQKIAAYDQQLKSECDQRGPGTGELSHFPLRRRPGQRIHRQRGGRCLTTR